MSQQVNECEFYEFMALPEKERHEVYVKGFTRDMEVWLPEILFYTDESDRAKVLSILKMTGVLPKLMPFLEKGISQLAQEWVDRENQEWRRIEQKNERIEKSLRINEPWGEEVPF